MVLAFALGAATQQDEELPARGLADFADALQALEDEREIPGMSAAIVLRQQVVWKRGFGHADLEDGTFAEPVTRYRLASCSKPFAAVLVMQQVEAGKLSLDAPMERFWIPDWVRPSPARYAGSAIRLRHVLTHTSEGTPGDSYSYNGNIYGDVTFVLEQVTGESYPRLLQERIFTPLHMDDTTPGHTRPGSAELVPLARSYALKGFENVPVPFQMNDPDPRLDLQGFDPVNRIPPAEEAQRKQRLGERFTYLNGVSSAGGIVSTVLDLARFDIALDQNRLLSEETKRVMFTPMVSNDGRVLPYAIGWFVEDIEGIRVIWHYGWLPPAVSALYVKVPARELTFLLLSNSDRLSAGMPWTASGIRASPFARAFLDAFVLGR